MINLDEKNIEQNQRKLHRIKKKIDKIDIIDPLVVTPTLPNTIANQNNV
jgi:hypothetical protein